MAGELTAYAPKKTFTVVAGGTTIVNGDLVKITAEDTIAVATADTDAIIGIADSGGAAGALVPVVLFGYTKKMRAGAAITVGKLVMPTTGGEVITATDTKQILGRALTAATAADEIVEVMIGWSFCSDVSGQGDGS